MGGTEFPFGSIAWTTVLALALGSCDSASERARETGDPTIGGPLSADSVSPSVPSVPSQPPAAPSAKAKSKLEDEAKSVLFAWLRAQNNGQFDAYEATFAKTLVGIKRVGKKEQQFNRAGWLKDRKRMFRKPMNVKVDEIVVRADKEPIAVEFTQTWASGNYKDVGAKRLSLVREGGKLLIAKEEMLDSTPVDAVEIAAEERKKVEEYILAIKPTSIASGSDGLTGSIEQFRDRGEVIYVRESLSRDHHGETTHVYYKNGAPFLIRMTSHTGKGIKNDPKGGVATEVAYSEREYILSKTEVLSAFEKSATYSGDYTQAQQDEFAALEAKPISIAVRNPKHFQPLFRLATFYRTVKAEKQADGSVRREVLTELMRAE